MSCILFAVKQEKESSFQFLQDYFSPSRIDFCRSMRSEHARILSCCAETAVIAACLYLKRSIPPIYARTENGKPYFPVEPPFLSISHSKSAAFCCICSDPVGIDAEDSDRSVPVRVMEKILFPGEISSSPIKTWTAKESYLKMTGEGLLRSMDTIRFSNGQIYDSNGTALATILHLSILNCTVSVCSAKIQSPILIETTPAQVLSQLQSTVIPLAKGQKSE